MNPRVVELEAELARRDVIMRHWTLELLNAHLQICDPLRPDCDLCDELPVDLPTYVEELRNQWASTFNPPTITNHQEES